jgi:phosphoribosylformylglycinamidine cyclo-ligase
LPIFDLLRRIGRIPLDDWRRTFNLGIGMVLAISPRRLKEAAEVLEDLREPWHKIGEVARGHGVSYH